MPYASTSLATLRGRLQDRYTADPFWTATDANDALNEALRYFNLFTGYWRGTSTVNTTINSPFVTVPVALTYRTRVFVSGRALTRKSILEFYRGRRDWRTQTTTSGGLVPTTMREWAPIGLRGIALWPADAVGGTVLTVDAVKITPILTADGQLVDIGDEELKLILDEALWVLTFKRPSLAEQMKPRHTTFLQGCLERNDHLRGSAYFRHALGLDQQQRLRHAKQKNENAEAGTTTSAGQTA